VIETGKPVNLHLRLIMKIYTLFVLTLVLVGPLFAQTEFVAPVPTLKQPAYDVSVGYDYFSMRIPSARRVSLAGVIASGLTQFTPRLAATFEFDDAHNSDVLGTGRSGHFLGVFGGPVVYLSKYKRFRTFGHALVGAGEVDSAIPTDNGFLHGWVSRPSYAIGVGIERPLKGPVAIRICSDYLRTAFADSSGAIGPQNNFRVVANFVFQLARHGFEGGHELTFARGRELGS
jgi:hypothetical protein